MLEVFQQCLLGPAGTVTCADTLAAVFFFPNILLIVIFSSHYLIIDEMSLDDSYVLYKKCLG